MLLILIPLAWLAIVAVCIAVCQAASRGDAEPVRVIETPSRWLHPGLVVWQEPSATSPRARPLRRPPLQDGRRVRSRRFTAHGLR